MTKRKPPGVSFETWVDRQFREATERGDFDNLHGAGKPIADLATPADELWWVKRKLRREQVSYLPPTLTLRKDAEAARKAASHAPSESDVRRIVTEINERIRQANRIPPAGPPLNLMPFDVERIVGEWREQRSQPSYGDPSSLDRHLPTTES